MLPAPATPEPRQTIQMSDAPTPFPPTGPQHGTVDTFDSHACLGTIVDSAERRWPFQGTSLVDGSREVDPGTPVTFVVARRHGGTFEADLIAPLRAEAVRAGVERVLECETRRSIDDAIVAGYQKHPQTEADAHAATASLRAAIEEQPW
jgi:hypothetical protein